MVVQASDEQLICAGTAGDLLALEALYDRYERAVYSFALQALGDQAEAEQAVVESYRRVWQEASGYHPGRGRLALWLYHLAQSAVAEHWRLCRRREPQIGTEASAVTLLSRQLRRALSGLPPELVQAVELAYFRGYTQAEIAERVGIPLGTVRARLTEAFNLLRNSLARAEATASSRGEHDLDAGLAAVYTLNLLPAYAARQFEAHLETCEHCSAEFAGFQAVGEILFHAVPLSEPDPGLKERVFEQVEHAALEAPAQGAVPLPRAAAVGEAEPLHVVPLPGPAEGEAAAAAEAVPPAPEPPLESRWAPAPTLQNPSEGEGLPPGRPTGRRPRPIRGYDRLGSEPDPFPSAPGSPQGEGEAEAVPPAPPGYHAPQPEPGPSEREAPAREAPDFIGRGGELDFTPRLPARGGEPGADQPQFRPAPLRAPVANPVAPHLMVPGLAESTPPRRPVPDPEPEPPRRRAPEPAPPRREAEVRFPAAPTTAAPTRAGRPEVYGRNEPLPGRSDRPEPESINPVAVARPRRQRDPETTARRQATPEGLERPLPALPAADPAADAPAEAQHRRRNRFEAVWRHGAISVFVFLVALCATLVYSSTQLWQRVTDVEALAMSRDVSLQKSEADAARGRPGDTANAGTVQVVSLAPPTGVSLGALGQVVLVAKPNDRHVQVQVVGMPALQTGEVYQVWLKRKDGSAASIGVFVVDPRTGRGELKTGAYASEEYQEVFITREKEGASVPQGGRLLQAALNG